MMSKAVLLGTGPSLSEVSLTSLPRPIFACNRIHLHPDWDRGWRPDFYLYTDVRKNPDWKYDVLMHLMEAEENGYPIMVSERILHDPTNPPEALNEMVRPRAFDMLRPLPLCGHVKKGFKEASEWHLPELCTFASPLYVAAQIAVMDGADELVFLGCDLGYKPGAVNNLNPDYVPRDAYSMRYASERNATLRLMHELIENECNKRGIQVYNATRGGNLEVHERIPVEEIYG